MTNTLFDTDEWKSLTELREEIRTYSEHRHRQTDPKTSREQDTTSRARHLALALLAHAEHPHGLTDFELADATGIKQSSIGVRRKKLQRLGLVSNTGLTRPVAPDASATAIVWGITELGKQIAGTL